MIADALETDAEDLYENAPCGYLSCRPDGTIVRANATLERWTGHEHGALAGRRFVDLLTGPGRIYHETHYAPLLRMQGTVREIALEIVRADGSRLPALINSVELRGEDGEPRVIRTTIFDATDRRRYEHELLSARRREQAIASELQRGLMGGELPRTPEVDLDVHYRPAVHELEVGGDWYDVFWLGKRRLALVVGDVVGRGITAAATMGQLRSAVRALASTGLGPAKLLSALDRYAHQHEVGSMTTLVCAELDLVDGTFRYAVAGHPPPLVIAAGTAPRFLTDGRSLPLDVAPDPVVRPEARITLEPGARVVLYTDGLVERRDRPLDAGLADLVEAVTLQPEPLVLASLVRSLEDRGHPDDVCVLSARLSAPA